MVDLVNLGTPQVANRAFVALAVEAGIETTIKSLVGLAMDKTSLLVALKEALIGSNAPLANALNTQTLDEILEYMASKSDPPVLEASKLPLMVDANGPASTSAARDGGVNTQINVTYTQPPANHTAEIYLDGIFAKHSTAAPSGGFVNDAISNVAAGAHTIRVLYRRTADGAITRFGSIVQIAS